MREPLAVLLVEDNDADAFLVRELLDEIGEVDVRVDRAEDLEGALSFLAGGGFDAILLDLSLPDGSGLDTVRQVRDAAPLVPVVVMSGLVDEALAVAALQAGAQDYLMKGRVDGHLLSRTLRYSVERAQVALALAEKNALLEERNAEQEAFVYTVSHDLRQPLLAIRGMSELLREAVERADRDEASFLLGRIERNVEKMGDLLEDLLSFSRAGRVEEPDEAVDLGDVVRGVLDQLSLQVQRRGTMLRLPEAWPRVSYPRSSAEHVVSNLLGNAVKFAGARGGAPVIEVRCDPAGAGMVALRVSDNGPGVPAALRDRVWGLFAKLDPKSEGTGVGLAIVKRIAERHGGRAWVEDSALGGAAFVVTMRDVSGAAWAPGANGSF